VVSSSGWSGVLGGEIFPRGIDPATGDHPVFNQRQRWAVLAAFALIVIFRLPHAWTHGRFQDEEATVFLAYAWHYPSLSALFRPFAGYWNLGATATTLLVAKLARGAVLPLESAPYVTMAIALTFQLMPAVLLLTGKAQWLERRLGVIAALLMVAIAPATEEVFFNVLHIQFHLALCVALILALDLPRGTAASIGYGVLLFLAPLCGPAAIVILPLFALRAAIDRDPGRLVQFATLAAGAALQLLLFYGSSPLRGHVFDPATIASAISVRLIALPLIGVRLTDYLANALHTSQNVGGMLWLWVAAVAVILFAVLIAAAARRSDGAIWLVLSALAIAIASFGFGIVIVNPADLFSVVRGERYNFLPLVLLGLALIALAMRPSGGGRVACASLCGLMLFNGAISYFKPFQDYAEGPSWPTEVQKWRKDNRYPLAVWPGRWSVDLSDETTPCSGPIQAGARPVYPRYCESGWAAGFESKK
jgi:hypothetical protein